LATSDRWVDEEGEQGTDGLTSPSLSLHLRSSPQKTHESQRQAPSSGWGHMALQEAQQAAAEGRRWLEPHLTAGPQSSSPSTPLQQSASARTVDDGGRGGVGAEEGKER
jgi:hypothetical protein